MAVSSLNEHSLESQTAVEPSVLSVFDANKEEGLKMNSGMSSMAPPALLFCSVLKQKQSYSRRSCQHLCHVGTAYTVQAEHKKKTTASEAVEAVLP